MAEADVFVLAEYPARQVVILHVAEAAGVFASAGYLARQVVILHVAAEEAEEAEEDT